MAARALTLPVDTLRVGAPPADIAQRYPDLVPEVPRANSGVDIAVQKLA